MTDFGFSFVPPPGAGRAGETDQLLDEVTLDYVRTSNGEWAMTQDSRTIVLLMLSMRLGASPFDPLDGVTLYDLRDDGAPLTPEEILSEVVRVGALLTSRGVLSDFSARVRDQDDNILRDLAGRTLVVTSWRDLATGSPSEIVFGAGS